MLTLQFENKINISYLKYRNWEKIKVKNRVVFIVVVYPIVGNEEHESQPSGLVVDRRGIVIEWKEEWANRMTRFQRRQFNGKCKSD